MRSRRTFWIPLAAFGLMLGGCDAEEEVPDVDVDVNRDTMTIPDIGADTARDTITVPDVDVDRDTIPDR